MAKPNPTNASLLKNGNSATIVKIDCTNGNEGLDIRLMELGFTKDENIKVLGRSLFASPIFVEIRGAVIALRSEELECLWVAPLTK